MLIKILPIIAVVFSSIGVILLAIAATKIGGLVGKVIHLLIAGIFLAVTVHAGFELVQQLGFLSKEQLDIVMGMLITIGSMFFIASGILAVKKFK
jgi:hypothetical protein